MVFVRPADVPRGDAWLGRRERAGMSNHRTEKRRAEWRAGRWAAKSAVASRLGVSQAQVEVVAAADGAPQALLADRRLPVCVSISHRDGSAVALATPPEVAAGCDLELIEARAKGFAADWLTPSELAEVDAATSTERDALITLIWSAKESVLKALRLGLSVDTRRVDVAVGDGTFDAEFDGRHMKGCWKRAGRFVITAAAEERLI